MFTDFLSQLELALDVPYPERQTVLDELAAHLESLHQDLMASGLDRDTAAAQALARLDADAEFVAAIGDVHRPLVAKALARLPTKVSLGIEYASITVIGAALVISTLLEENPMIDFITSGGVFMIPIHLAGIAIVLIGIERLYSLYLKRDHGAANLGKRLLSLRFLATGCALTGALGTLLGFYQAFASAPQIMARFHGEFPIFEVARIAMTTAIWGMTLALIAVVLRFVVEAKTSRIAAMRRT